MSRTVRSSCFLLAILIFAWVPSAIAQRSGGSAPRGGSAQPPVPDYGRLADPTVQANLRFQPYDKTPLDFSTRAIYVLVPVVVTDKRGNHVSGLKREDFHLEENGKDQKVASVEEIKPTAVPISRPTTPRNEITNQSAGDAAPRRLVIIALDMVNTPILDQTRARQAMISYLSDNLEPDCLYQLVAIENNGLRILHDFSEDTAALVSALKTVRSKFSTTNAVDNDSFRPITTDPGVTTMPLIPSNANGDVDISALADYLTARGEQAYGLMRTVAAAESTLVSFQEIAERASGIPGRKSLVWLTGSFPFSIDPGTASVNEGLSFATYQHTMQLLENQLISVYPVDARGLVVAQFSASEHLSANQLLQRNNLIKDQSNRLVDTLDTMRAFADMTGGHAYVNTNDTGGAIRDAARDGAAYYMLSYAVDKSDRRQGWRKITVKVGNYQIRARHGYFLTQTTVNPLNTAKYDMDNALKSPLDYTGLPVRIVLNPVAPSGDKRKVTFAMMMPPKSATIDSDDKNHMHVDIAYAVWTATGKDAGHKGVSYNLKLNPTQLQQVDTKGLSYGDTLELAPGSYKLRLVVRDNLTGQIGSVSAPLDVK
jgi:VWFA-related protein